MNKIKYKTYEILSKNFFSKKDRIEVFCKKHLLVTNIKIISIYDKNNKNFSAK